MVAGASQEAVNRLLDKTDPDITARFKGVEPAWRAVAHTGYGQAVQWIAEHVYGLREFTGADLARANERLTQRLVPGERYRILREVAKLDHVQVDNFCWPCPPDASGPTFFLYDLSWASFCNGQVDVQAIDQATGIEVKDLASLNHGP